MTEHGIECVAVIGAGTMGAQIASLIAVHGHPVVMTDALPDALERASARIDEQILPALSAAGIGTPGSDKAVANLKLTPDFESAVVGADLVIEAVREDVDVKMELFARLDALNLTAILASNSSSIPTSQIVGHVERPERVMNMHFFAPIWVRTMVEIMTCGQTDEAMLSRAQAFGEAIGLVAPIVRVESKGFIINRIWRAVKRESLRVVDEGVAEPEDVDRLWMIFFQTELAPFGIMDMVGGWTSSATSSGRTNATPWIRPTCLRRGRRRWSRLAGLERRAAKASTRILTLPTNVPTSCRADSKGERDRLMYSVVFLVTKRADMTQEEFVRYWIEEHTPLTATLPGLRSYRCYPMIAEMDGPKPPFDGFAYIAFDDEASCRAALESAEFKTAVADGPNFQTVDATYGYFAKEYVIV